MENYVRKMEDLEPGEIAALRKLNLGYGNFIENVRRLDMCSTTYRYILDRGYGNKKNINKIRAILLKDHHESRTHQPAENSQR